MPAVQAWRSRLRAADGLIFSTPEYAHGIPGVLKNALDWVVGSGELVDKPVTLFNASDRATYAQASLTETLRMVSARVEAPLTLPLLGKSLSPDQILADPTMFAALPAALQTFIVSIHESRHP